MPGDNKDGAAVAAGNADGAAAAAGSDAGGADKAGGAAAAGGSVLSSGSADGAAAEAGGSGADAGGADKAGGASASGGEKKAGSVPGSVLADGATAAAGGADDAAAAGGDKKAGEPGEKKAPTAEEVGAFVAALKPEDLGIGADGQPVAWDEGAVKAVAPVLMELGLDGEKSQKVIAAYAGYRREQFKAAMQAQAQTLETMKQECVSTFGADLRKVAGEAYRGGLSVFGPELFSEFLKVPEFGNDVRVLKALAAVGRAVTDDRAAGSAAVPAGAGRDRPLSDRIYTEADFQRAAAGK